MRACVRDWPLGPRASMSSPALQVHTLYPYRDRCFWLTKRLAHNHAHNEEIKTRKRSKELDDAALQIPSRRPSINSSQTLFLADLLGFLRA